MPYRRKNYKAKAKRKRTFVRKVKSAMNKLSEHKWVDKSAIYGPNVTLAFDAAPAAATAVKPLLLDAFGGNVAPVQGTTANNRVGDRIRLLRLRMKGVIVPSSGVGACRVIIGQVTDSQDPSAPTLTYGEILNGLVGTTYACITSAYNHEPLVQYKILADQVYTWDANNASAPKVFSLDTNRFKQYNINYDGTGNVHTGMLFYVFMSANGQALNMENVYTRLTFVDY